MIVSCICSSGFEDLLGGLDETAQNDLANFDFGREVRARAAAEPNKMDENNGNYFSLNLFTKVAVQY